MRPAEHLCGSAPPGGRRVLTSFSVEAVHPGGRKVALGSSGPVLQNEKLRPRSGREGARLHGEALRPETCCPPWSLVWCVPHRRSPPGF